MTQKTRATTIQQKFGFKDEDLRMPKHDEMMLWLDAHALEVAQAVLGERAQWSEQRIAEINKRLKIDLAVSELPARNPLDLEGTAWEIPVMSGKYIVGFIDLEIKCQYDKIDTFNSDECIPGTHRCVVKWETFRTSISAFVEVKTSIPSLGELIRQIRMYQEYQKGTYVVVSPDARFANALRSQGIEFYHYALGGEV